MIIIKINTYVAFPCLLMGMTDLYEKRIMLIERLDNHQLVKGKKCIIIELYFH